MAEGSKIEWTDHTFNPWVGCTKVSPACDHCYAEGWAKRTGGAALWQGERRKTSAANWRLPIKWNKHAGLLQSGWAAGVALHGGDEAACIAAGFIKPQRPRVFCASLADVFDNQAEPEWREELFELIRNTPHLDWLLLTKRPQNIKKMIEKALSNADIGHDPEFAAWPWPNVWIGTTVENQQEADRRIPHLLAVPARVRFLSCEPLLGPVDLTGYLWGRASGNTCPDCPRDCDCECGALPRHMLGEEPDIAWVIVGGESGPNARPMQLEWALGLRDQCEHAGVAFFMKQMGGVRKPFAPIPDDLLIRHWPEPAMGDIAS